MHRFSDAWLTSPRRTGPAGTMHAFTGEGRGRIDWVLYRGDVEVESVEVITRNEDGLYPSDHFPVLVTARL
jgi:endonuclease/exonuclease/phosphatase family metal-dependent hydrolase